MEFWRGTGALGFKFDIPDGVLFQSTKIFKPLQAADILAWNMRNHMDNVVSKGKPDAPPHIHRYFEKLRLNQPVRLGCYSDMQTQEAFEVMKTHEQSTGERAYILPRKKLEKVGPLSDNEQ
jgi:hypothetical protein